MQHLLQQWPKGQIATINHFSHFSPIIREVIKKANEWLSRHATPTPSTHWCVLSCESIYAKVMIDFAENGEIKCKRVAEVSKWPLFDENYLNSFDPNQGLANRVNVNLILEGRFIVQLLRVWLIKKTGQSIGRKGGRLGPKIGFKVRKHGWF